MQPYRAQNNVHNVWHYESISCSRKQDDDLTGEHHTREKATKTADDIRRRDLATWLHHSSPAAPALYSSTSWQNDYQQKSGNGQDIMVRRERGQVSKLQLAKPDRKSRQIEGNS